EKSFIATLSVSAETTKKAIEISNVMVKAFQEELASADAERARNAAAAFDDRLNQLKDDVLTAEDRVEAYRRTHKLSTGENGQLVSSENISQLNTAIAAARTRVIDAQVNYNSLQTAESAPGSANAAISPTLAELLQRVAVMQQQYEGQRVVL